MTKPAKYRPPVLVNPAAEDLGRINAVLTGTSRSYHVSNYKGSLSLKTVLRGSGTWEADQRRFVVRENCWLVLNDGQRYSLEIDSRQPTTTFCVFFQRGFVEDIWRSKITRSERLLDEPDFDITRQRALFVERLGDDEELRDELRLFRNVLEGGYLDSNEAQDAFVRLASRLVSHECGVERRTAELSATRASTQKEICKRVMRGRDLLLSAFDQHLTLKELAHAACMSPYHFHRSFRQLFGATPHALLTKYRLRHAAIRLRASNESVTAISAESGFESLPSFSALFRRHFGETPSHFRQRNREK